MADIDARKNARIHSMVGGVGITAVHLTQYECTKIVIIQSNFFNPGKEITDVLIHRVFVSMKTNEKREFLKPTFNLAGDYIFNSRTIDFSEQALVIIQGDEVSIIPNSLIGDVLNKSLRVVMDGATMVEIGNKGMLDRNNLPSKH